LSSRVERSGELAEAREKAKDIDWTKDKPDNPEDMPFYCPLCHTTIQEIATYDIVFDHNKQLHNMTDEDAETLAKAFTFSNSPPTEEYNDS
tara:strand:+ start:1528 stop:1800 length:273 start_codon:yes stop_codon:yes gene_type:complete